MSLKRLLWFALLAFAVFFVVQSPDEAGRIVKETGQSAGAWAGVAARAFAEFVKSIAA